MGRQHGRVAQGAELFSVVAARGKGAVIAQFAGSVQKPVFIVFCHS